MSKINDIIEKKLDVLERLMEQQMHIRGIDSVNKVIGSLNKYTAHMNDEQNDFVEGCRYARDEQKEWIKRYKMNDPIWDKRWTE